MVNTSKQKVPLDIKKMLKRNTE